MNQEQLLLEMNKGAFITIEAPDRRVSSKVLTILQTALKYEFKDKKFVVIDPATCTELAGICQACLNQELYGASRLLLAITLLSETANIIRTNIDQGINVICTSYITDMVMELVDYYNADAIAAMVQLTEVSVVKNAEIILMSPLPENDYYVKRLQKYHAFVTAAIEDNSRDGNQTITYRIDTSLEPSAIEDTASQVIQMISSTLASFDELKSFAQKLFSEEETPAPEGE